MTHSFPSFAKINLHLRVVGRRADGYHELVTIFQTVDAHDVLEVEATAGGGGEVDFSVLEGEAPTGRDNLVVRAAEAVLERWAPDAGARIGLRKRLPIGGGLGGGSGNAATTILALVALLRLAPEPGEVCELASGLGADVPFFLTGGTALGLGRGDRVEALSPELPATELWLFSPPTPVATAEVFAGLTPASPSAPSEAVEAWRAGKAPSDPWEADWRNDLEPTVRRLYSEVDAVYNPLIGAGASCVRLSGSGGTVFARFPDDRDPSGLVERLPAGTEIRQVRTLDRASYVKRLSVPELPGG